MDSPFYFMVPSEDAQALGIGRLCLVYNAVWNKSDLVKMSIRSASSQTFKDSELIIVDGGSENSIYFSLHD